MERDVGLLRLYPGIPASLVGPRLPGKGTPPPCWGPASLELGRLSWPPPLQSHYGHYDGFVVIHGTDTMAFAASVLSFVLENLQKTVILTGAQVRAFLQPPMKGVVMETFGSGNGPTKPDLLQELRAAAERGLVIVNCTHCLQGAVTSDYGAGVALSRAGTVSGFDMTSEAALAKLSYVLGLPGLSLDGRKELLARDLRGEMTPPAVEEPRPSLRGGVLGRGVAQLLSLRQEADEVWDALVPSLACAAAYAGELEALQVLVELGSDRSLEDFSGQTPLHAAARAGQTGAVTMLLQRGLDVNARDKGGLSPLLLAVRGRHRGVIGLLRAAGACLSPQELEDSGTELCRLASRADCEGLLAWGQAGADPRQPGQRQLGTWKWWPSCRTFGVGLVTRPRAQ
ncbi:ASPG [Cervus elaphus hippelaphus]|uniref:asparaginase n=1 Tax=Cervus elaphus hippelaphus TaxID=46360 RepID=A0A212CSK7_CEREH|nr:ASPG [Cervus elaphus hippelaphus]